MSLDGSKEFNKASGGMEKLCREYKLFELFFNNKTVISISTLI